MDNLKLLYKREEKNCVQKEAETEAYVKKMLAEAEMEVEKKWTELSTRLEAFYKAHEGLRELLVTSGRI